MSERIISAYVLMALDKHTLILYPISDGLKRAHIIRGWLTVLVTDAMIQKSPRQTNCIPYYIKQVQL